MIDLLYRRQALGFGAKLLALSALPFVAGCKKSPKETVLYVTLELGNPFFTDVINGLKDSLGSPMKWDLDVRAGKSTDDASGQIDIMEAFLVQHNGNSGVRLMGLVLDPAQSGPELADMIRQYNLAKIPVINTDTPIDPQALSRGNASVASFIGSNNLQGGQAAATVMAEKLSSGGDVLVLLGAPGSANAENRRIGFVNQLKKIGTQKQIDYRIREWSCNWSATIASTATESLIQSGTLLRGIFAANDEMALGAAQAVDSIDFGTRPKPVIIGYDATPDARNAIQDGRMYASISQNPRLMGQQSITYLEQIVAGSSVPSSDIIPVSVVMKS